MPENKTQPTAARFSEFLDGVENDRRRSDAQSLAEMMKRVSGVEPRM
jgi:hypothetical protein